MGTFWWNGSLQEYLPFQLQLINCSYRYLPHRKAVKAVGKKASMIYLGSNDPSSDHKKAKNRNRGKKQGRLKNGGCSYWKSRPILVPTVQKRSQGDGKCSEELYETTQKTGKLDFIEHEIKGSWSIGIIWEKLKQLAHSWWWNTGEAVSDSKHIFYLAKKGRKI